MNEKEFASIILGTGSYSTVLSGNTVSITGDGGNAWGYNGPAYKKLAPRFKTYQKYADALKNGELIDDALEYYEYRKYIESEYIKEYYETRLKDLSAYELLEILEAKFGRNIILLCHEPINEFCHRRLDADYIELKTGIYIPEISVDEAGNITKHNPIRYKEQLKKLMKK